MNLICVNSSINMPQLCMGICLFKSRLAEFVVDSYLGTKIQSFLVGSCLIDGETKFD